MLINASHCCIKVNNCDANKKIMEEYKMSDQGKNKKD